MGRDIEYNRMYRAEVTNSPNPRGFRPSIHTPGHRHAVATHNEYCQHISLINGHARMCEEPTGGRTYCKKCAPLGVLTATDRKLTDAQVTDEKHPWRKPMKL